MAQFIRNIMVLFRKELLVILKDPRSRVILIVPIIIQSLMFGYVATFDLNDVEYALLDEDRTATSFDLVSRFDGSKTFERTETLDNSSQIADKIDRKKAVLVLHIGYGFEKKLMAGEEVPVQVIVDGRNANVAGIASGYAAAIIDAFNRERLTAMGIEPSSVDISTRAWFNPNLETRWNLISGLVVVLSMIQGLLLSSLTVTREKEQGTFDQLLVTPCTPFVILAGKALPCVIIGLVQSSLVLLIALYWFHIPFAGSYPFLYFGLLIVNCSLVGVGLCISTLTSTMQQAMLYSFSLIITMMLLSGFVTPVTSMPDWLQSATLANPVRYGVEIAQRIYLEGAGFAELSSSYAVLAGISVVTLGAASRLFRWHLS